MHCPAGIFEKALIVISSGRSTSISPLLVEYGMELSNLIVNKDVAEALGLANVILIFDKEQLAVNVRD